MALVGYSDSEGSDEETTQTSNKGSAVSKQADKPTAFHKLEPRKIRVDLPSLPPTPPAQSDTEPPSKRARTTGTFSGFNSLLPPPKRIAAPRAGVSLKTSSEAAFRRDSAPAQTNNDEDYNDVSLPAHTSDTHEGSEKFRDVAPAPEIVGKATRFKPLSVANKKKPPTKKAKESLISDSLTHDSTSRLPLSETVVKVSSHSSPPAKPKRSLFSVMPAEETTLTSATPDTYESANTQAALEEDRLQAIPAEVHVPLANSNSLQSLASDLNLTTAERRQLFGRSAKNADVKITHFNMDSEYAANEEFRQAGEAVEHRAVKAIAPGKHSLQQLVNNARSQQDAMEDKWADGRRERGEGAGRYGWSK